MIAAGLWSGLAVVLIGLVALDLLVTGRTGRALSLGQALAWTWLYVFLALAFTVLVYFTYELNWLAPGFTADVSGRRAVLQYFTAWLVEKSLSVENVFVIALVFSYFGVPRELQHRVLLWGVVGALAMRVVLIGVGSVVLRTFPWSAYAFGALLVATAVRMLIARHDNLRPDENPLVRWAKRRFAATDGFRGARFFVEEKGRTLMTPLFVVLLVIQGADLVLAVDAVPASLAVTSDPFIVITANAFALLGLRSLYFVLAVSLERLRYLKISLAFVVCFAGVKMLLSQTQPIPNLTALTVIVSMLGIGAAASLVGSGQDTAALVSPLIDHLEELGEISLRHARRVVLFLAGSIVALTGIALMLTPAPGSLVLMSGLSLLAIEFEWARRWQRQLKDAAAEVVETIREQFPEDEGGPGG